MIPTIVVVAYNRPESLKRLLGSLQAAVYPFDEAVRLVVSIDGGGSQNGAVQGVAHTAVWPFGPKEIITHETNLGLIDHLFSCGDLSEKYGQIVLLEDDLFVSARFFAYASQALAFYEDDPQIAGISLNALWFNGFTHLPFTPYLDNSDSFFVQVAWFQGQAYTAAQWRAFRQWFAENDEPVTLADEMHEVFTQFAPTEWFPRKSRYLVKTGRFYAFPRQSLSVNFGDAGTHFAQQTRFFQLPLQNHKEQFHFQRLADSLAVYDSYQELLPDRVVRLAPHLAGYDFAVDFYGTRDRERVKCDYLLTTQPSTRPVRNYGLVMRPLVANVVHEIEGEGLVLTAVADLDRRRVSRWRADWLRYDYYQRVRPLGWRRWFRLWFGRVLAGR